MAITVDEQVVIRFKADMATLKTELNKAQAATAKTVSNIGKELASVGRMVAVGVGAGALALGVLISKGIDTKEKLEELRDTVGGLNDLMEMSEASTNAWMATLSRPFYVGLIAGMKTLNSIIGVDAPNAIEAMGQSMKSIAIAMVKALSAVTKGANYVYTGLQLVANGWNLINAAIANRDDLLQKYIKEQQQIVNGHKAVLASIKDIEIAMTTAVNDTDNYGDYYNAAYQSFLDAQTKTTSKASYF